MKGEKKNGGRRTEDEKGKKEGKVRKIVLVSPHLDDAVFSVGGLMAALTDEEHELHLVTCFTRSVLNPTGFALACQLDKGLTAEVDYMELRRQEDTVACQRLKAQPIWLDLPEAPHRGYESAPALFEDIHEADQVQSALVRRLQEVVDPLTPDLILSPVGIGNHVDHQQVKRAVDTLRERSIDTSFLRWYDEPYLSRHPASYPPKVAVATAPGWEVLARKINSSSSDVVSINAEPYWDRKMAACAAYTTQLGFQFGGTEAMKAVLAKGGGRQNQFTELFV